MTLYEAMVVKTLESGEKIIANRFDNIFAENQTDASTKAAIRAKLPEDVIGKVEILVRPFVQ